MGVDEKMRDAGMHVADELRQAGKGHSASMLALQDRGSILHKVIGSIDLVFVVVDADGVYCYSSANMETLAGWTPDEMSGTRVLDHVHAEDVSAVASFFRAFIRTPGASEQIVFRHTCKGGTHKWVRFHATNLLQDPDVGGILGNYEDITAFKETEAEHMRLNTLLNAAQRIARMGAWELDLATNKTFWSDEVYVIHEVDKDFDHNKSSGISFYHPQHQPKISQALERAIREHIPFDEECRFITAKGTHRWVRSSGYPMVKDGNVTHLIGMLQDITERKQADLEQKAILETTNDGFFVADYRGRILDVNAAYCEMLGYMREELLQMRISDVEGCENPAEVKAHIDKLRRNGFDRFETLSRRKDGSLLEVEISVTMLRDFSEKMVVFVRSISERKQAERERAYQIKLLSALFQESPVGICLNDFETGAFLDVNDKLVEPSGYTKEEFLALSYWDLTPKEYAPQEERALQEMQEKGFYSTFEKEYVRKDGTRYPVRLNGVVVEGLDGKKHIWSIIEDVSERKQAEEKLIQTNRELEEATARANDMAVQAQMASSAKSAFLANMSHEIRTPLNGVIGFTDLLKDTSLSQEQEQYINSANIAAHTLLEIVNNILDFSKIEAGMLHLEMIKTDMIVLLEESVDLVKYAAAKKGLELLLRIDPGLPRFAVTDPVRLKQILANLLGNAVKFTKQGEVELAVAYTAIEDGKGTLSFSVRDTGIGISKAQQAKLFSAFSQGDSSTTREFGGTGLGLAISDMIAQKMGSKIQLESKPGAGSTFSFDMKTETQAGEKRDQTPIPGIKRKERKGMRGQKWKILIAEDVAMNLVVLKATLQKIYPDAELLEAGNGREAVRQYDASEPDLILMDVQMPVLDGLSATRKIREREKKTGRHIPIIALTAGALSEEAEKCRAAGMDDFLTKPIDRERLSHVLVGFLDAGTRAAVDGEGSDGWPALDGFDLEQGRRAAQGDPMFYRHLLHMFAAHLANDFANMEEIVASGNHAEIKPLAHTLKGLARTAGAVRLASVCSELDDLCGGNAAIGEDIQTALREALQSTRDALGNLPPPEQAAVVVDDTEGAAAFAALKDCLHASALVEDDLLDMGMAWLSGKIGLEKTQAVRTSIETFDHDAALAILENCEREGLL